MNYGWKLRLLVGYVLALLGAIVKTLGALVSNSKSLFVDGLTCIANVAAGAAAVYLTFVSLKPPDKDHPYGHGRFLLAGAALSLIVYAFIAGIAFTEIISVEPYSVDIVAPAYAALGFLLYGASILILRRLSYALLVYAELSSSELLESVVTIMASYAGATLTYLIDYVGSLLLFTFLTYELVKHGRNLVQHIADYAPPRLLDEVKKLIESQGLRLCRLRIRTFVPGIYCGDAVVAIDERDLERAHAIIDRVEKLVEEKLGVRLVIHYEPGGCE